MTVSGPPLALRYTDRASQQHVLPHYFYTNTQSTMTRFISYRLVLAIFLPILFVISACDSGGSNDEESNEFSLQITTSTASAVAPKAVSDTTIDGYSFFYSDQHPQTGEEVFSIYLSGNESFSEEGAQEGLFGFLARNTTRPSEGTYDLVDLDQGIESGDFVGVLFEDYGSDGYEDRPFYVPTSGTVTLSQSSSDRVEGSVDLNAHAISFDFSSPTPTVDTTEVDITGSFSARDVQKFANLATPSGQ